LRDGWNCFWQEARDIKDDRRKKQWEEWQDIKKSIGKGQLEESQCEQATTSEHGTPIPRTQTMFSILFLAVAAQQMIARISNR
jgi:hypothetical protein